MSAKKAKRHWARGELTQTLRDAYCEVADALAASKRDDAYSHSNICLLVHCALISLDKAKQQILNLQKNGAIK